MLYKRRSKRRGPVLAITALLAAMATVSGLAGAETAAPRTDAVLSILSDSSAPDDPADGIIPTFDVAKFLLNVSQNGADSTGQVTASVALANGNFVSVPPACQSGSSNISADRTVLTCGLGSLPQGTSVAIEYEIRASGEVANGDQLTGTVTVDGTDPIAQPPLTITGTNRLDVSKETSSVEWINEDGVPAGWFITYDFKIRTGDATNKGGLPLDEVSFVDDWSDLEATWPGVTIWSDSLEPGPVAGSTGTWTMSTSGSQTTITATGFGNAPPAGSPIVSSRRLRFHVPLSSAPLGTTSTLNTIADVSATPRGGPADSVFDLDPTNNEAGASVTMFIGTGEASARSAWVSTSYGESVATTTDPTIGGVGSSYKRTLVWPWVRSSGGEQVVIGGNTIVAEAIGETLPWLIDNTSPDGVSCILFDHPVTAGGDAKLFSSAQISPSVVLPISGARIEYGTVSDPQEATCADSATTWSTSRPASFNAVRGWADMRTDDGRVRQLVLQVPVTVPTGLPARTLYGFTNTFAFGNFGTTSLGPSLEDPAAWAGIGAYDIASNSGDNRFGDRIWVVPATASFTKKVCGAPGAVASAAVGDTIDFCLTAVLEGSGTVPNLKITDFASYLPPGGALAPVSLGDPASPVTYRPGTAVVTINGTAHAIEPVIGPDGDLVWDLNAAGHTITSPATIEVRFTAASQVGVAAPGGVLVNYGFVEGDTLTSFTMGPVGGNPHVGVSLVQFATGRAQLQIEKSKSTPDLIAPNDPITWEVRLRNTGATVIGATDMIDVLPFNSDGSLDRAPESSFSGTVGVSAAPTVDSGTGEFLFTSADPQDVAPDPQHPSNQPSGTTTWCPASDFGEAGCPSGLSVVTAVRYVDDTPLAVGDVRTVTIPMSTVDNAAGDIYTNDAGAVVRDGEPGPVLSIRSNDVTVTVAAPGLVIDKTTEDQMFVPGVENTYEITATNTSELHEPEAVVTDRLIEGLEFVEASDGGVYDSETRTVTWPAEALAPGADVTYTLTVRVADPAPAGMVIDGAVPNTAAVTGTRSCELGPLDPECTSTVSNPVAETQLAFAKVVDAAHAVPGDHIIWTLTVSNAGPVPATGVVAVDRIPAGVAITGTEAAVGEISGGEDGTLTWTIGDLGVAETVTATISATVNDESWGTTLINQMTATSTGACFGPCPPPVVEHPCEEATWSCAVTEIPGLPGNPDPIDGPDPVTPDPTVPEPPAPTEPVAPEPPADNVSRNDTAAPQGSGALPRTGSATAPLLLFAVGLIALGVGARVLLGYMLKAEKRPDRHPFDDIWT